MKRNITISFFIIAIFWIVNVFTIFIYKKMELELTGTIYLFVSPLIFLIWFHGTNAVFYKLRIEHKLKIEYRLPLLRTLILIPVILLDIVIRLDKTGFIAEYPIYLIYLYNEFLLPISLIPVRIINFVDSSFLRILIIYTDTVLLFGLLEILILKIAKKITSFIVD